MEVSGQLHTPADLLHEGKNQRYTLGGGGGCVGLRAGLDSVLKRKKRVPTGNRTPFVQPRHYTD